MKRDDQEIRERTESRIKLENFNYFVGFTFQESNVKDRISLEHKAILESIFNDTRHWLDINEESSKEEFERQLKEVGMTVTPIMNQLYGQADWTSGIRLDLIFGKTEEIE